jgi:hypothetical protein
LVGAPALAAKNEIARLESGPNRLRLLFSS